MKTRKHTYAANERILVTTRFCIAVCVFWPFTCSNRYNNGQNPFVAAQNFIDKNELPQSYLNEIADHLTKRTGESAPTIG